MKKLLTLLFLATFINNPILANETSCKKFDLKCKAKSFIQNTKDFQNEGIKKSKTQINQTKEKVLEKIPKK